MYNHSDLRWQWDWAGAQLINKRILVCDECLDVPQEQLRAKILSADPIPIWNARPEPFTVNGFSYDESNIMCMPRGSAGDFSSDFNADFWGQSGWPTADNVEGPQMLMPDGVTVMLMPNNPEGLTITGVVNDFNQDFNRDYNVDGVDDSLTIDFNDDYNKDMSGGS
jgi:hypothetical protein